MNDAEPTTGNINIPELAFVDFVLNLLGVEMPPPDRLEAESEIVGMLGLIVFGGKIAEKLSRSTHPAWPVTRPEFIPEGLQLDARVVLVSSRHRDKIYPASAALPLALAACEFGVAAGAQLFEGDTFGGEQGELASFIRQTLGISPTEDAFTNALTCLGTGFGGYWLTSTDQGRRYVTHRANQLLEFSRQALDEEDASSRLVEELLKFHAS